MTSIELNAIAAMCSENRGIGLNNTLPWQLPSEYQYFLNVITSTRDKTKVNALITGRRSWLSMKCQPLETSCLYFIISSTMPISDLERILDSNDFKRFCVCKSVDEAVELIQNEYSNRVESIYAIGGVEIYRSSMQSPHFKRFYLTRIMELFECDVFLQPQNFLDSLQKIASRLLRSFDYP